MEKISNILGDEKAGNESINTRLQAIDKNFNILKPLQQSVNLYVDPNGDDTTGDGSEPNPYKTIQKALNILPKNLGGNNATINISNGTYSTGFNAADFYSGVLVIKGDNANKAIINSDCVVQHSQLNQLALQNLKINGNKSNIQNLGILAIDNVINCGIYATDFNGTDKAQDGIRISGQSSVGITNCTINNCRSAISTVASSGTRGLASVSVLSTQGSNNSIGINNDMATISVSNNNITADTQYQKASGIIINSDGTLL